MEIGSCGYGGNIYWRPEKHINVTSNMELNSVEHKQDIESQGNTHSEYAGAGPLPPPSAHSS